jgi:uncharacterized protein
MTSSAPPKFRDLEPAEIEEVLLRNHVGRIAFARGGRIDIVPVHYVYGDGWIYGRTSPTSLLREAGEHWWPVAFEVDETVELFDWRSVVVRGGLYLVSPDGPPWEREAWETGVALLRQLFPGALLEGDPVPFRNTVFRIAVQEVTGKTATPG